MSALVLDLAVSPEVARRLAHLLPPEAETLRLEEVKRLGLRGTWRLLRKRRFERLIVIVNDFRAQGRWASILALALATRARERTLVDPSGRVRRLGWGSAVTREVPFLLRRWRIASAVRRRAAEGAAGLRPAAGLPPIRPQRVAFVRTDLTPPLEAGGSLAHIRGVVSGLRRRGIELTFVTPGPVAGFDANDGDVFELPPDPAFRLSRELPALAYNRTLLGPLVDILREHRVELVYHRYGLGSYAAAAAAQALDLPLVVEFNGSEVWIARQWGEGLENPRLMADIERACLRAAHLVVAVSEPLRRQLHDAGVDDARILINPNGVDLARFDPARLAADRTATRRELGVADNELLAGFVGTFGPWHGAEPLARAACEASRRPGGERLRYLFVGDGARRAAAERILGEGGCGRRATFLGLVEQDRTPALLAACDLCVAPHVPNADGTPFFGSPTKLFEYMAAGRAVLASDLDQIGEVLEHDRTAWLVPPGDVPSLAGALARLASDPALRERLGSAARRQAVASHGWDAHVARILDRLAGTRVTAA